MTYDWKAAERERNLAQFAEAYLDAEQVVRWKSNDRCPFEDMLTVWLEANLIGQHAFEITLRVRAEEDAAAIRAYAKAMAERTPEQIAEERAEMLAAFGPGETVVNVLTGEKTTL